MLDAFLQLGLRRIWRGPACVQPSFELRPIFRGKQMRRMKRHQAVAELAQTGS